MTPIKKLATSILSAAVAGAAAAIAPAARAQTPAPSKPNVVLILADDLGYGDLGCYSAESKIPTPNLDKLASQGMRFTNAYTPDAVCSPSRYGLLTGRYAWRNRPTGRVLPNYEPPMIETARLTLPALMQNAGYNTAALSKWHLGAVYTTTDGKKPVGQGKFGSPRHGSNLDLTVPLKDGPTARGFDYWYGFICATEALVFENDRAVAVIDAHKAPATPVAQSLEKIRLADYLPLTAAKAAEYIRQQAPAAKAGKPFFLAYFPYVPHTPLTVIDDFKGKTRAGDYGDYVHELDHYLGQVLDELDKAGVADNTIVLFASDNGSQFDGPTGQGHRPNGILRGRKHGIYEGGVRTPLIVRWPGKVAPGSSSEQLVALIDCMATFAAITDQPLPAGAGEDSISFLPTLLNRAAPQAGRDHVINCAAGGQLAIREGDWKYIAGKKNIQPQLYNLRADPSEKTDVAAEHPEVASKLKSRLEQITATPPKR